jgi:hypothetical protein
MKLHKYDNNMLKFAEKYTQTVNKMGGNKIWLAFD